TINIYYNGLISMLCPRKEDEGQGMVAFCRPRNGLLIFILLLLPAAPPAFAAAPADITVNEKIAAAKTEKEISKRESLYRELGDARDIAATPVLSQAALSDTEPGARIDAILALRKIGGPEALKGLLEALSAEKHKGVRIQIINSLGFFNAQEALARLRDTAKNDPDRDLRISAAMALSRLNDTQTLSDNFSVETDSGVKLGIIDALGRSDGGEKELKKIKAKNKDAKTNERLDFYTGEQRKKAKKK
ncbi:MAG: HEAT repeat domain-containing protein, partial [Nitrospirota bacterium]|nr:HEAT repeat domain-containing protein [Nitrospirota bacterium]